MTGDITVSPSRYPSIPKPSSTAPCRSSAFIPRSMPLHTSVSSPSPNGERFPMVPRPDVFLEKANHAPSNPLFFHTKFARARTVRRQLVPFAHQSLSQGLGVGLHLRKSDNRSRAFRNSSTQVHRIMFRSKSKYLLLTNSCVLVCNHDQLLLHFSAAE